MPRLLAWPYLRPRSDRIKAGGWRQLDETGGLLPEVLADWDPNTNIEVYQQATVDVPGIREDCGLNDGSQLVLAVTWHSPGTMLRGVGTSRALPWSSQQQTQTLNASIPGQLLGGSLRLVTVLTVVQPENGRKAILSPSRSGSLLWESESKILLEGRGSRFPVEVVNFEEVNWVPSGAGWVLDWLAAPDQSLLGHVRLLINSRHKKVAGAVAARNPTSEQQAILSTIYYDVGRTLIRGMLSNDEFVEAPDSWSEGTVGFHVATLLRVHFPGQSTSSLRAQMEERASSLEADLQSRFELFSKG
jgi:hypothetical protein